MRWQIFQEVVDVFAARYRGKVDSIGGFDARGFVLGPPIALALKVPFFMLRKPGKMPNSISSSAYQVEYGKRDGMCIPRGHPLDKACARAFLAPRTRRAWLLLRVALRRRLRTPLVLTRRPPRATCAPSDPKNKSTTVKAGDRVLLVDDLVATGGTLSAGIELVRAMGATVVEVTGGLPRVHASRWGERPSRRRVHVPVLHPRRAPWRRACPRSLAPPHGPECAAVRLCSARAW